MNNSTPTPKKITLEDIAQRKQEVLQGADGKFPCQPISQRLQ